MLNHLTNFFSFLAVYMIFILGWYNASWQWMDILISNDKRISNGQPFIKFLAVLVILNCSWLLNFFMLLTGLAHTPVSYIITLWTDAICERLKAHIWRTDSVMPRPPVKPSLEFMDCIIVRLTARSVQMPVQSPFVRCVVRLPFTNSLYNDRWVCGSLLVCCKYSWALLA